MILLDTDTLTLLMQGHSRVMEQAAGREEIATTVITRIEILQGRFASILKAASGQELLRAQHWLVENEKYLSALPVVLLDNEAASHFEKLTKIKKLKKIGRADLLIASITLAHRAVLVTRNLKHFQQIPGLQVEDWAD